MLGTCDRGVLDLPTFLEPVLALSATCPASYQTLRRQNLGSTAVYTTSDGHNECGSGGLLAR